MYLHFKLRSVFCVVWLQQITDNTMSWTITSTFYIFLDNIFFVLTDQQPQLQANVYHKWTIIQLLLSNWTTANSSLINLIHVMCVLLLASSFCVI